MNKPLTEFEASITLEDIVKVLLKAKERNNATSK